MSALRSSHGGTEDFDPGRAALPAGDPLTWEALVGGTCLDGLPWPGRGLSGWDAPHRPRAGAVAEEFTP